MGIRTTAATLSVLGMVALIAGCDTRIAGTATSVEGAGAQSGAPSSTGSPEQSRPAAGDCTNQTDLAVLDCSESHDAEIVEAGQFPANMPDTLPDENTVTRQVLPGCRESVATFVGSPHYDVTSVRAWLYWPSEQDWAAGQRWRMCAAVETNADGQPSRRSGSLRGALAGNGYLDFQLCSSTRPSKSELKRVSCDGPHVAEAIPGVLDLGDPSDPFPSEQSINDRAMPHCNQAATRYVGTTGRPDIAVAWRWPSEQEWAEGFTNVTCYVETQRPVRGRVHNLGGAPLPG
ncbi:MAG: hypothetical protein GEU98_16025 [Pseudonocardiaceae bacterium]|nr:hypothetical protein [Pseudonocardiaceae bacterium]